MAVQGTSWSDSKGLRVAVELAARSAKEKRPDDPIRSLGFGALAVFEVDEDAALHDPEAWRG